MEENVQWHTYKKKKKNQTSHNLPLFEHFHLPSRKFSSVKVQQTESKHLNRVKFISPETLKYYNTKLFFKFNT